MLDSIVYAKKLVLPSAKANCIQTLQMAAAFADLAGQENIRFFFYPGLKAGDPERRRYLEGLGIEAGPTGTWRFLGAKIRGLYGARFRLNMLRRAFGANSLYYARDLDEASLLAKLRRFPLPGRRGVFLFEMHEALFKQRQAAGKTIWPQTRRQEQAIMDVVDGLVVINPALAEEAGSFFNYRKPVLVEPSGYSERLFKPVELFSSARPWPAAHSDSPIGLVYLGSVRENKGMSELLKAMRILPERFRLTVFGRGLPDYMAGLENLLREIPGGENRVRFAGFVPQAELYERCGSAHISVIPQQRSDGYFSPMKLNESLALGLPVVATPLKIFESFAALVCTARDCGAEGLAEAIMGLAGNPALAEKLRQRGLEAVGRHTWSKRARRIFEFAQTLAKSI